MSSVSKAWAAATVGVQSRMRTLGPHERARRRLADRYLRGCGLEIGALHNPKRTKAEVKYVDRLSRTELRRQYPELAAVAVVEPDIIDDGEFLHRVPDSSQDFIIANHFIEHCEDPIGTLQTFAVRLRPGGVLYMAVPDKRFTFDKDRPSTTIEHLENDHRDRGSASRWAHYLEFARLACFPEGAEEGVVNARASQMLADRYSIHFHVWTTDEFGDFLDSARLRHVPELDLKEVVHNGNEGIFVLRRA